MQELGLMERFADPALFESLTFGDKVAGSLVTTLMGMGTTFAVLILLWAIIALMTKIMHKPNRKESTPAKSVGVIPAAETPASQPVAASAPASSGQELIAVLMAAIAASQGAEVVSKLRIRKIERISGNRTPWNAAGSAECIDSRKF